MERWRRAGWRVLLTPAAEFVHEGGRSGGDRLFGQLHSSLSRYAAKHHGPAAGALRARDARGGRCRPIRRGAPDAGRDRAPSPGPLSCRAHRGRCDEAASRQRPVEAAPPLPRRPRDPQLPPARGARRALPRACALPVRPREALRGSVAAGRRVRARRPDAPDGCGASRRRPAVCSAAAPTPSACTVRPTWRGASRVSPPRTGRSGSWPTRTTSRSAALASGAPAWIDFHNLDSEIWRRTAETDASRLVRSFARLQAGRASRRSSGAWPTRRAGISCVSARDAQALARARRRDTSLSSFPTASTSIGTRVAGLRRPGRSSSSSATSPGRPTPTACAGSAARSGRSCGSGRPDGARRDPRARGARRTSRELRRRGRRACSGRAATRAPHWARRGRRGRAAARGRRHAAEDPRSRGLRRARRFDVVGAEGLDFGRSEIRLPRRGRVLRRGGRRTPRRPRRARRGRPMRRASRVEAAYGWGPIGARLRPRARAPRGSSPHDEPRRRASPSCRSRSVRLVVRRVSAAGRVAGGPPARLRPAPAGAAGIGRGPRVGRRRGGGHRRAGRATCSRRTAYRGTAITIGCDGCRDATAARRARGRGRRRNVRVVEFPERRGKAAVLNDLVRASTRRGPRLHGRQHPLRAGGGPRASREAVAGPRSRRGLRTARLRDAGRRPRRRRRRRYWDRETRLKEAEGRARRRASAPTAAIYAARRALVAPLPPDTTSMDDFLIPVRVAREGATRRLRRRRGRPRGRRRAMSRPRSRAACASGSAPGRCSGASSGSGTPPPHPLLTLAFLSRKAARWLAPLARARGRGRGALRPGATDGRGGALGARGSRSLLSARASSRAAGTAREALLFRRVERRPRRSVSPRASLGYSRPFWTRTARS